MKKLFARLSILLAGAGMLVTSGILAGGLPLPKDDFVDPITDYAEKPIEYQHTVKYAADEEVVEYDVNKVILHYLNDDKKCDTRRFYLWANGVDGKEFPRDSTSTQTQLDTTIDFINGNEDQKALKSKIDIRLIVKFQGDWNGQSEDTIVAFKDFPPNAEGVVEIWMVPGIGAAIECFDSYEKTQSDKVTDIYFSSFKSIHVVCTAAPGEYRLYSYDQRFLAMSSSAQAKNKETRLLKTGSSTTATFDIPLTYNAHINMQYVLETEYPNYPGRTHIINIPMHKFYAYDGVPQTKLNMQRFDQYYTYDGDDLGVKYSSTQSTFKVWAPTAGLIKLNIYEKGTPTTDDPENGSDFKENVYEMVYMKGGVWACTLLGDLNGKYYTYTVYNSLGKSEVVDPYAHACGANGHRGMILNFDDTDPEGWEAIDGSWHNKAGYDISTPQELTIYEAHIRDLTKHSTWKSNKGTKPGTYLAFAEKGTTHKETGFSAVSTGFDHLRELGINAIQFTPVFDHDNTEYLKKEVVSPSGAISYELDEGSYNWGYNPLNYNCVEGQYSSDPNDGAARVREFKQLIYTMATSTDLESGTARPIRAIMDVVYNHVSSGPNSNFTKLMPRYYFRYTDDTTHWDSDLYRYWDDKTQSWKRKYAGIEPDSYFNGSGCSNEVKTEAKMMRKFIVESLCWWAKEYNIKGFRFDLMGLIDVVTLKEAAVALKDIDPDIYMYGEGWTGDGNDAHVDKAIYQEASGNFKDTWGANSYCTYRDLRQSKTGGVLIGAFNDAGRDGIRGSNDRGGGKTNNGRLPNYGFMSKGTGDQDFGEPYWRTVNMFVGNNSNIGFTNDTDPTDHTIKDGNAAKQTVNYASCHDNYSLFDQFSGTLGTDPTCSDKTKAASVYDICRASTVTNISVMLSNGVAFMQGGEELFRSKVVASAEERAKIREFEDYAWINGTAIAHNAYKSSDDTNAFDWSRKVKVTYNGVTDNNAYGYFQNLAAAIKERGNLTFKSNCYLDNGDPNSWSPNPDTNCSIILYFIRTKTNGRGIGVMLNGRTQESAYSFGEGYTYNSFITVGAVSVSGRTVSANDPYAIGVVRQKTA